MFSFLVLLVTLLLAPRSIYSTDTVVYSADSTEWQFPAGLPTRVPRGQLHDVCNSVNELDARAVILISGPEDVVSLTLNGFRKISLFGIIFPLKGVTGPCPNPTISNLEVSPGQALSLGVPAAHACKAVCSDTLLASYSLGDASLGDTITANFSAISKIAITSAILTLAHADERSSTTFETSLTPSQTSSSGTPTSSQNIQPAVPENNQCTPIQCDSPPPSGGVAPVAGVPARPDVPTSQSGRDAGTSTTSTSPTGSISGTNTVRIPPDALRSSTPTKTPSTTTTHSASGSGVATNSTPVSPTRILRAVRIAISTAVCGGIVLGLCFIVLVFYLRRRRQQHARASVSSYTLGSRSEVATPATPSMDKARALKDAWEPTLAAHAASATPLLPTASGSRLRSLPIAAGSDDTHAETRSLPPRYGAWRF